MTAAISDRPIRIGIVDDNEFFRCTLHSSLDQLPNLKVVAEAENGSEALSMVEFLQPDIVLMDISMPGLNGIEVTRNYQVQIPQHQCRRSHDARPPNLFRPCTPSRGMPVFNQGLWQGKTP
jgi:CheY-like chemotaxis protein